VRIISTNLVLPLAAARSSDVALVGAKAANLGELARDGLPVPPGFVITTAAFRHVIQSLGIDKEIGRVGKVGEHELCAFGIRLQRQVTSAAIEATLANEISEAHACLRGADTRMLSVVRSSATAEDTAAASFAGQHRTYYCVEATDLLEKILRCWASLWTPEAIVYRIARGIAHMSVAMAVIVQRMIPSEVSGTAFTADPVSGERGHIVIESSWGLGSAVVDGRVTPDRYIVNRETLETESSRIADKRFMVRGDRIAMGVPAPVPESSRRIATLSRTQLESVVSVALQCEELLGAPQDIEWTFADDSLHLLQSRPITTARLHETAPPAGKWVLFKPIVENFADPLTPLQIDLMGRAFSPFIQAIGGRFYVNVKWVRRLLPFRLSDEAVATLLYLTSDGSPMPRFQVTKLPLSLIACVIAWLASSELLARSQGMPDDFMDAYRALCRNVEADPRVGPLSALRRLLTIGEVSDPIGLMVVSVNCLAALRTPFWVGAVRAMLRRWEPSLGEDAVAILCAGSEGILTVEMGRDLASLAGEARKEPEVTKLLATTTIEDVSQRLRELPVAQSFLTQVDAFLFKHGHRAVKEFEVQTARWGEDPTQLYALLRSQLAGREGPEGENARRGDRGREQLEKHLRSSLGWRWIMVRFAAGRAREFLKLRENSRFYHIMGFGVVRKKILDVEEELIRDGKLGSRGDIFYLLWSEVIGLRSGSLRAEDAEQTIQQRRIEHLRRKRSAPPRTLGITMSSPQQAKIDSGNTLYGQCASPGRYEGVVRLIRDPGGDTSLTPGEVLVAPYADPAWTPLFLAAGAAVVEVGSYLSHSGTIAREYGMPFVVDVAGCTQRLENGMHVLVDASAGMVRILVSESE